MHAAGGREQSRQLSDCHVAKRDKIIGLAPGGRFLGATGFHHLTDNGGQHSRRVLPANQIEALERSSGRLAIAVRSHAACAMK
jgi:hypothetical protein